MKSDFSQVTAGKFLNSFVAEPPPIHKKHRKNDCELKLFSSFVRYFKIQLSSTVFRNFLNETSSGSVVFLPEKFCLQTCCIMSADELQIGGRTFDGKSKTDLLQK